MKSKRVQAVENTVSREPEADVLVQATRRKGWLKRHTQVFAVGASIAVGLSMLMSLFDGDASILLALTGVWAAVLGGHWAQVWTWERANGELLARVRAEEGNRCDPALVELEVRPANADWIRLWDDACARFLLADQALQRLGNQGLVARGDLQASMGQVKLLVQGQARLETAMRSLASGELDDRITELKWSIERTEDERLRRIVTGNLDLLEKQRKTVQSLRHDTKRIKATVEGFALAAQNIHLNATRLGASGEQPDQILAESLTALEEEVRVMRLVEAELEGL